MALHGINQGKHFIYCHLMDALMSTCDPISFKILSFTTSLILSIRNHISLLRFQRDSEDRSQAFL